MSWTSVLVFASYLERVAQCQTKETNKVNFLVAILIVLSGSQYCNYIGMYKVTVFNFKFHFLQLHITKDMNRHVGIYNYIMLWSDIVLLAPNQYV